MRDTKVLNKLDELKEEIVEIKLELGKQHGELKEHTRRSLANEKAVEILQQKVEPLLVEKTKSDAVYMFLGKAFGAVSVLLAIAVGIKELLF